jgi:TPR repeat protein
MLKMELKNSSKWILKAATLGDQKAIKLTTMPGFDSRDFAAVTDVFESFNWLKRAADLKDSEARYVLGLCYSEGYFVRHDDIIASSCFLLAATQGHVKAQLKIAERYIKGLGITVNYPSAVEWLKHAAKQGNAEAKCSLEMCFQDGKWRWPDK